MYNILIINKDNPLLINIKEILEGQEFHVDSLTSGLHVIEGYNVKKYDLILIDVFIQGIFDAYSIAKHIRIKNSGRPKIFGISDNPKFMEKDHFDYICECTNEKICTLNLKIKESLRLSV